MDLKRYCEARNKVIALADGNKWCAVHAVLLDVFEHAVAARPKVIVDLGVRSTEAFSSKVFVEVAGLFNGRVFACDKEDCWGIVPHPCWHFAQVDAIKFSTQLPDNHVDVLCIDTTERYEDVRAILEAWTPKLKRQRTIMLRCSNLQKTLCYPDGTTTGLGWDNERGVARAIEDFLCSTIDETVPFQRWIEGWMVTHVPWGAGLTVLRRFA